MRHLKYDYEIALLAPMTSNNTIVCRDQDEPRVT